MQNNPTYLGTVQDVQGATISISLDPNTISGIAFIDGHGYRIGQVGSFIRIPMGYIDIFGIVSQVGAGAVPETLVGTEIQSYRWMKVQMIGEGKNIGGFRRGITQYPTVGDIVHLVTEQDLVRIYGRPELPNYVKVGHLASAESIPALIDIDRLLTRHSAVLGATGAGKSTTVAGLVDSLSAPDVYPSARILILDIHGEYPAALRDRAFVFRINPVKRNNELPLCIPYWALNYDELLSVTLGDVNDASRAAILERITDLKKASISNTSREGVTCDTLTVDTPIPFSIHKFWFDLHRLVNATHHALGTGQSESTEALLKDANDNPVQRGDAMRVIPPKYMPQSQVAGAPKIILSNSPLNIRSQLEALASRLRDPRYDFLFRPGPWLPDLEGRPEKDLDELLRQWIGGDRAISILDLSGIPSTVLSNLVGALLRIIYEALFWARDLSEGGRERPLLIILEEAHSYLGQGSAGPAALAVRRIVKEGRKYGIGAMIVSQRPAEIDTTILSQCGTLFAMRLSNPTDRAHVAGAVADNLEGLFSMLPTLRIGEAIIVGEAVHLPVRTLIDPPARNRRPDSTDPQVYVRGDKVNGDEGPGGWNRRHEREDYKEMIAVWRKQDPRSPRMQKPKPEEV